MQQDVVIHRAGAISGHLTIDSGGILSKTDIIATLVSTTLFGNTEDKDRQHHPPRFTENELTDDRGFYRIAGLPPGKYRIEAQVTEHFDKPEQTGTAGLYVYAPEALQESDAKLFDVGRRPRSDRRRHQHPHSLAPLDRRHSNPGWRPGRKITHRFAAPGRQRPL